MRHSTMWGRLKLLILEDHVIISIHFDDHGLFSEIQFTLEKASTSLLDVKKIERIVELSTFKKI